MERNYSGALLKVWRAWIMKNYSPLSLFSLFSQSSSVVWVSCLKMMGCNPSLSLSLSHTLSFSLEHLMPACPRFTCLPYCSTLKGTPPLCLWLFQNVVTLSYYSQTVTLCFLLPSTAKLATARFKWCYSCHNKHLYFKCLFGGENNECSKKKTGCCTRGIFRQL